MDSKRKILVLAVVAAMSLAGCGTQQATQPTSSDEPPISNESMPSSEVVSSKPSSTPEVDEPEGISSSSSSVVDEKPVESKLVADTAKQEATPPAVGSANSENGNHPFGSEEHRQYIYETEWLNEENKSNTQFFDTFDEYYNNYYVTPFAGLTPPNEIDPSVPESPANNSSYGELGDSDITGDLDSWGSDNTDGFNPDDVQQGFDPIGGTTESVGLSDLEQEILDELMNGDTGGGGTGSEIPEEGWGGFDPIGGGAGADPMGPGSPFEDIDTTGDGGAVRNDDCI